MSDAQHTPTLLPRLGVFQEVPGSTSRIVANTEHGPRVIGSFGDNAIAHAFVHAVNSHSSLVEQVSALREALKESAPALELAAWMFDNKLRSDRFVAASAQLRKLIAFTVLKEGA